VEHALELSLFEATVVPWYEMLPEGERGTFRIDAMPSDSRSLTQSDYATFITLTESNKQGSQHWKGNIKHDPSLGSAYAAPVIRTRKRWTSKSIVPLYVSDISIEPSSATIREHEGTMLVFTTVSMSDGTTTQDVRYESSDPTIATVDSDGLVSYVSEGSVIISAISTFDNVSRADCKITTIAITFVMSIGTSTSGVG
ncbi:Ig-like domain-containing protein, partial [Vibrio parahaemolyticus]|nr:Ig-like domain-containing protein [Vibrio parahaemolyticus]